MRQLHKEQMIEQGQNRSLWLIAICFAVANIFLIIGFSQTAHAIPMDSAMVLARMLAAPEISATVPLKQMPIMATIATGLCIMLTASIVFAKNLLSDLRH